MAPTAPRAAAAKHWHSTGLVTAMYGQMDVARRMQGEALAQAGYGQRESAYRVTTGGPRWRLRHYGGPDAQVPVLIVGAPIKRPYIWDLTPARSAVNLCRAHGLGVYLLEWTPPGAGDAHAGLAFHARDAIGAAVAHVTQAHEGRRPVLMGHSLGGTLAALYAALRPADLAGVVLLGAPLAFGEGSSGFRDSVTAMAPEDLSEIDVVPGALLSHLAAVADPASFVVARMADAGSALADPAAAAMQARVERWALDEMALPRALVSELLTWLYREDRFARGWLTLDGAPVRPSGMATPCLVVTNRDDSVAGPSAVRPAIADMPRGMAEVLEHDGEPGVGLQHLAILIGRTAHAHTWPRILDWMAARA